MNVATRRSSDLLWQRSYVTIGKNPLGKWLGVIKRGAYQASSEDSRWSYEPVSDLWPVIEPDSDSSDYGLSEEVSKY